MKTLPISEVRENLPSLVDEVDKRFERVQITVRGRAKAYLLSADDYEGWMETFDILSDSRAVRALIQAQKEINEGQVVEHAEVLKQFKR